MRVNSFIQHLSEGLYDPGIFKAFFLAGGPGSGKTFVTSLILNSLSKKNKRSKIAMIKPIESGVINYKNSVYCILVAFKQCFNDLVTT